MSTGTEKAQGSDASTDAVKKHKHRSPNHPLVGLDKAIDMAGDVWTAFGAHEGPVNLAHKACGYKEWSAIADQCIAALKSYGLIDVTGTANARKVQLSPAGNRIVRNAPDRSELIRKSALSPPIHKEIVEHYGDKGLPSNPLLRQYLVWERQEGQRFNEDTVDAFIVRFRSALQFAGIESGDIISKLEVTGDLPKQVAVGDFVQWESSGALQFPTPKPVTAFSEEGLFAFFEDSPAGIPVAELIIQDPPTAEALVVPKRAPANPLFKPPVEAGPRIEFPLPDGNSIEIRLKKPVSKKDFDRIIKLVQLSEDSLVEQQATHNH